MQQYLALLQDILVNGQDIPTGTKSSETGEPLNARSVIGRQLRFDLRKGFPAVTTKELWFKGVKVELIWMLRADTNLKFLHEHNVHIWDEWADANGDLGPIYGVQWRKWPAPTDVSLGWAMGDASASPTGPRTGPFTKPIDQLQQILDGIREVKTNPNSRMARRLILTAWNVAEIQHMKLPPCHTLSQFFVRGDELSCHLYQRSGDAFLGVPFNIAQYALLLSMLAHVTGLKAGELIHSFGDVHLYSDQLDLVEAQLYREPLPPPSLWLNPAVTSIDAFTPDDIRLENYQHHPKIKRRSVAV